MLKLFMTLSILWSLQLLRVQQYSHGSVVSSVTAASSEANVVPQRIQASKRFSEANSLLTAIERTAATTAWGTFLRINRIVEQLCDSFSDEETEKMIALVLRMRRIPELGVATRRACACIVSQGTFIPDSGVEDTLLELALKGDIPPQDSFGYLLCIKSANRSIESRLQASIDDSKIALHIRRAVLCSAGAASAGAYQKRASELLSYHPSWPGMAGWPKTRYKETLIPHDLFGYPEWENLATETLNGRKLYLIATNWFSIRNGLWSIAFREDGVTVEAVTFLGMRKHKATQRFLRSDWVHALEDELLYADADADGMPDVLEREIGTSPATDDTNGNGVPDGQDQLVGSLSTDGVGPREEAICALSAVFALSHPAKLCLFEKGEGGQRAVDAVGGVIGTQDQSFRSSDLRSVLEIQVKILPPTRRVGLPKWLRTMSMSQTIVHYVVVVRDDSHMLEFLVSVGVKGTTYLPVRVDVLSQA